MKSLFCAVFPRPIVMSASPVSLVVGWVLNPINQFEAFFSGGSMAWGHMRLNYLVPYAVPSYSAARNQVMNRNAP